MEVCIVKGRSHPGSGAGACPLLGIKCKNPNETPCLAARGPTTAGPSRCPRTATRRFGLLHPSSAADATLHPPRGATAPKPKAPWRSTLSWFAGPFQRAYRPVQPVEPVRPLRSLHSRNRADHRPGRAVGPSTMPRVVDLRTSKGLADQRPSTGIPRWTKPFVPMQWLAVERRRRTMVCDSGSPATRALSDRTSPVAPSSRSLPHGFSAGVREGVLGRVKGEKGPARVSSEPGMNDGQPIPGSASASLRSPSG